MTVVEWLDSMSHLGIVQWSLFRCCIWLILRAPNELLHGLNSIFKFNVMDMCISCMASLYYNRIWLCPLVLIIILALVFPSETQSFTNRSPGGSIPETMIQDLEVCRNLKQGSQIVTHYILFVYTKSVYWLMKRKGFKYESIWQFMCLGLFYEFSAFI